MSGVPRVPAALRLRAIREAWLRPVIIDRHGLRRLSDTFDEHLAKREVQPRRPGQPMRTGSCRWR
jgi:hypothetical protein